MISKYIVTFSVILYAIAVPILELNSTHVFNPNWTPHVRIHEVWQLITNSSIGLLCLYLSWKRSAVLLSAILSLLITGGFLVGYSLKALYGGSMVYLDGSEKLIFGVNLGVAGFGLAAFLLCIAIYIESRRNNIKY